MMYRKHQTGRGGATIDLDEMPDSHLLASHRKLREVLDYADKHPEVPLTGNIKSKSELVMRIDEYTIRLNDRGLIPWPVREEAIRRGCTKIPKKKKR